jgi:hypothetical protein
MEKDKKNILITFKVSPSEYDKIKKKSIRYFCGNISKLLRKSSIDYGGVVGKQKKKER